MTRKKTKKTKPGLTDKIIKFIGSSKFFYIVVGFFVLQAGWLALSASYPMLYDEYYHPGFIEIYSHQYSPFIREQTPEQTSIYGDITRAPSYLYHYLMSFPFRLIGIFTDSFYIKIVGLRLLNVGFVAAGLIIFRKLLQKSKFSKPVINSTLFLLVLLPIFVHVAAHINYDNLIFLLTSIFLLIGTKIVNDKTLDFTPVSLLLSLGFLACVVKFTFIPIFGGSVIYILLKMHKENKLKFTFALPVLKTGFKFSKIATGLLLLVSFGLFLERYAVNLAKYHNVQPRCDEVQSIVDCKEQPVLKRSYRVEEEFKNNPTPVEGLGGYTLKYWLPAMIKNTATVATNKGSEERFGYTVKSSEGGAPIPILETLLWVCILCAPILLAYSWRENKTMPYFWYFVSIILVYTLSVWIYVNYLGYIKTGQSFAVQPRYFIIFMPIIIAYTLQSANQVLNNRATKLLVLTAVTAIFTQGGGISTYIVRSNEGWYWSRSIIVKTNLKLKQGIAPFIKEK